MPAFIEANWLTLVSILIGVLVAFVFYRLQKKDSVSAAHERKKHATNELLDVVESYIINKQKLSEHVVDNLIFASERDHVVSLRGGCTPVSLLQDVALRLQRSRHLDIPQKSEYSLKIEELIQEIRDRREPPPLDQLNKELQHNLSVLESLISTEKRNEAKAALNALASVSEKRREFTAKRSSDDSVFQIAAPLLAGIASSLAAGTLASKFFSDDLSTVTSALLSKVFPIFALALVLLLTMLILGTALRIRRRGRKGNTTDGDRSTEG
ncbi:Uncharacterised protein [Achromobacter sp. 2789STDY5608615]|uniref:hypothetical protein n=1 Tax=Achromobacter sp. 2789STDY5608615 TaxID=1806492 RepID=UPI0006C256BA|nr:hypothetical protein [Achromobacter sp. 2789STDY5608615]CUK22719.1 Uncharacterised protein [Achromobacter sp. 2789STDY5608615]